MDLSRISAIKPARFGNRRLKPVFRRMEEKLNRLNRQHDEIHMTWASIRAELKKVKADIRTKQSELNDAERQVLLKKQAHQGIVTELALLQKTPESQAFLIQALAGTVDQETLDAIIALQTEKTTVSVDHSIEIENKLRVKEAIEAEIRQWEEKVQLAIDAHRESQNQHKPLKVSQQKQGRLLKHVTQWIEKLIQRQDRIEREFEKEIREHLKFLKQIKAQMSVLETPETARNIALLADKEARLTSRLALKASMDIVRQAVETYPESIIQKKEDSKAIKAFKMQLFGASLYGDSIHKDVEDELEALPAAIQELKETLPPEWMVLKSQEAIVKQRLHDYPSAIRTWLKTGIRPPRNTVASLQAMFMTYEHFESALNDHLALIHLTEEDENFRRMTELTYRLSDANTKEPSMRKALSVEKAALSVSMNKDLAFYEATQRQIIRLIKQYPDLAKQYRNTSEHSAALVKFWAAYTQQKGPKLNVAQEGARESIEGKRLNEIFRANNLAGNMLRLNLYFEMHPSQCSHTGESLKELLVQAGLQVRTVTSTEKGDVYYLRLPDKYNIAQELELRGPAKVSRNQLLRKTQQVLKWIADLGELL